MFFFNQYKKFGLALGTCYGSFCQVKSVYSKFTSILCCVIKSDMKDSFCPIRLSYTGSWGPGAYPRGLGHEKLGNLPNKPDLMGENQSTTHTVGFPCEIAWVLLYFAYLVQTSKDQDGLHIVISDVRF